MWFSSCRSERVFDWRAGCGLAISQLCAEEDCARLAHSTRHRRQSSCHEKTPSPRLSLYRLCRHACSRRATIRNCRSGRCRNPPQTGVHRIEYARRDTGLRLGPGEWRTNCCRCSRQGSQRSLARVLARTPVCLLRVGTRHVQRQAHRRSGQLSRREWGVASAVG